jgi:hypothetical protein
MSDNLGTALPKEMSRVRDEMIPQYLAIGPAGNFAIAVMRNELDRATRALAEGDLEAMIRSYVALKGFKE